MNTADEANVLLFNVRAAGRAGGSPQALKVCEPINSIGRWTGSTEPSMAGSSLWTKRPAAETCTPLGRRDGH